MKYLRELVSVLCVFAMIYIFLNIVQKDGEILSLRQDVDNVKLEVSNRAVSTTNYVEQRINRLAQLQDDYQNITLSKINLLETKTGLNVPETQNNNMNINNIVIGKQ